MSTQLFCLFLSAAMLNAGTGNVSRIRLVLNDTAETPQEAITTAMIVARRALLVASVETEWVWRSDTPAQPRSIYVHLVPSLAAKEAGEYACGRANAPAATIYISASCAHRLASSSLASQVGRVVGYLIAHEVGHVLLADHRHDQSGLMRADFGPRELLALESGRLRFESPELLRQRAQQWIASRDNTNQTPTN